jgi:hypothetical protein
VEEFSLRKAITVWGKSHETHSSHTSYYRHENIIKVSPIGKFTKYKHFNPELRESREQIGEACNFVVLAIEIETEDVFRDL